MLKPDAMLRAAAGIVLTVVLGLGIRAMSTDVVFTADSEFGRVHVTEQVDGLRSLYIGAGRARQSAVYPDRPRELVHAYTRTGMIGPALTPPDGRILFVGLGGGAMPTYVKNVMPYAHIDIVEINPVVIDVARRYFGFHDGDRMVVHTGDGRRFIEDADTTWDLIVLDAFDDDEIPYSLATRQFLDAVRSRLTDDGVVISNLWTANDLHASMVATYAAVFDNLATVRVPRHRQQILIASVQRPIDRETLIDAARAFMARTDSGIDLVEEIETGYSGDVAPATVLEDR